MIDFSDLPLLEIDGEVTESHRNSKTMAESKAVWIWKRPWTQRGLKRTASHWACTVRNRHFPWVYLRSQITGAGEGCEAQRLEDRIHNLDLEQDKMFLCCSIYAVLYK